MDAIAPNHPRFCDHDQKLIQDFLTVRHPRQPAVGEPDRDRGSANLLVFAQVVGSKELAYSS